MVTFYKYHGTGNDFIIIDNYDGSFDIELSASQIELLCHRRFGIGADGLMIINPSNQANFEMIYFNSDGHTSSMCGNGGRCIAQCFFDLGYGIEKCSFMAIDGLHTAESHRGRISLRMQDVHNIENRDNRAFVLDTGSPHYIQYVDDLKELDSIVSFGQSIRYNEEFKKEGINVNQVNVIEKGKIKMATYERGVEDETYSCGTGVVAASLTHALQNENLVNVEVLTKGGSLSVRFQKTKEGFTNIDLIGPAVLVYKGTFDTDINSAHE